MLTYFSMALFGSKTAGLLAKSKRISNTFIDTLQSLRSVNTEIAAQDKLLADEQARIQKERNALNQTLTANARMAEKIEDFLGTNITDTSDNSAEEILS